MRLVSAIVMVSLASLASARAEDAAKMQNWPGWRGPLMSGAAPEARPPLEWSEEKNVRWKVDLPGLGHATPIVWQERIYVLTAIEVEQAAAELDGAVFEGALAWRGGPAEQPPRERRRGRRGGPPRGEAPGSTYRFSVLALDRATGKTVWERVVCTCRPHEGMHQDSTFASNSPVTDGEHVFAYFGSRGLYCLDMDGQVVWEKDLGDMQTRHSFGEGSSPALHGDTIVVNWDHEGDSFIVALDKRTGEERWRRERDEVTSWSTPVVIEVGGQAQVVVSASKFIRSYALSSGKVLWKCGGMTLNVIPTPIYAGGLLYAMSGFRGNALLAIRVAEARGDISDSEAIAWRYDQHTSYVPSALLYEGALYFLSNRRGLLTCLDARTGAEHYTKERLPGIREVYASPVGARGHVYIVGRGGTTAVLKHGSRLEVVAENKLDDRFDASPVLVDDQLFLRGREHLYCIAPE